MPSRDSRACSTSRYERLGLGGRDRRIGIEKGRLLGGAFGADREDHARRRLGPHDERLETVAAPEQGFTIESRPGPPET